MNIRSVFMTKIFVVVMLLSVTFQARAMQYAMPTGKIVLGLGCLALSTWESKNKTLALLLGHSFLGYRHSHADIDENLKPHISQVNWGFNGNVVPLIAGCYLIKSAIHDLMRK